MKLFIESLEHLPAALHPSEYELVTRIKNTFSAYKLVSVYPHPAL